MIAWTEWIRWGDLPGHASYLLIALSYLCVSVLWLRVLAVAGLALEIVYFLVTSPDLYAGVGWDLVFMAINLWRLAALVSARRRPPLPRAEMALLRAALPGLDDRELARLAAAGERRTLAAGAALTRRGAAVGELVFLLDGAAGVAVAGAEIARLRPGAFVGEMAYLTGAPASAVVAMAGPGVALAFDARRLVGLLGEDSATAAAFNHLIGRDLARKIAEANARG